MKFKHIPAMVKESIEFLAVKPDGIYVDATLGGGGHAEKILVKLSDKGKLIGIDQDGEAIKFAKKRLARYRHAEFISASNKNEIPKQVRDDLRPQVIFVHDNFKNLELVLNELNIDKIDGILLDLGVSSYQLENPERGFSFKAASGRPDPAVGGGGNPWGKNERFFAGTQNDSYVLDMRMDQGQKLTASEVVNNYSEEELRRIFFEYGEEKFSRSIAREVVKCRREKPIRTANDLVEIIKSSTPPKYRFSRRGHYATKIFQALRIEVNQELEALRQVLPQAVKRLKKGGRLVVISFHSLEDRIVKHFFRQIKNGDKVKILFKKPLQPSQEEIRLNPRAESAKMRAVEKIC